MLKAPKNRVLIISDGKKKITESGLIMANYSLEGGTRRGTVHSVGTNVKELKEGDRVAYPVEEGNLVTYEGIEYALMYEAQVFGILENEDD